MGWPKDIDLHSIPKSQQPGLIGEAIHLTPLGCILASIVAVSSFGVVSGSNMMVASSATTSVISGDSRSPRMPNRRRLRLSDSNPLL
jgi:hypothetical protein